MKALLTIVFMDDTEVEVECLSRAHAIEWLADNERPIQTCSIKDIQTEVPC